MRVLDVAGPDDRLFDALAKTRNMMRGSFSLDNLTESSREMHAMCKQPVIEGSKFRLAVPQPQTCYPLCHFSNR